MNNISKKLIWCVALIVALVFVVIYVTHEEKCRVYDLQMFIDNSYTQEEPMENINWSWTNETGVEINDNNSQTYNITSDEYHSFISITGHGLKE